MRGNCRLLAAVVCLTACGMVGSVTGCRGAAGRQKPEQTKGEHEPKTMKIGAYAFQLPPWWDSVDVRVPDDLVTEKDVISHVTEKYGADVGTSSTWKQALKTWAIASTRMSKLPVFIAHCYSTGEAHKEAARVYGELYELADTQGDSADWYRAYLSYQAGREFMVLGNTTQARFWFSRAAQYRRSRDVATRYYAREAMQCLASPR